LIAFATLVFSSLLAMVNPLGALPIFVGLTASYDPRQRRRTALRACIAGALVLFAFALFGSLILRFFGITTHAFRIAGGILFFFVGWEMLQARRPRSKTTQEEELESAAREDIAVVPLGIPTLAGPGAITTVVALMDQASGPAQTLSVYGAIALVLGISLAVLLAAPGLLRLLGQTGINVMTRLMGLLIMVVGVQFVLDGLSTAWRLVGGG
jgi:multiple antibiotic resistance protein